MQQRAGAPTSLANLVERAQAIGGTHVTSLTTLLSPWPPPHHTRLSATWWGHLSRIFSPVRRLSFTCVHYLHCL